MILAEAALCYVSICAFILAVFERVEKYSNKSDLETYYLLITMKNMDHDNLWNVSIKRFFDKIFGNGMNFKHFTFPSFFMIMLFNALLHTFVATLAAIYMNGLEKASGRIWALLLFYSFISCSFTDYFSFAKTRTLLRFSANRATLKSNFLYFFLDVILTLPIMLACSMIFMWLFLAFIYSFPEITASALNITPYNIDGRPNWIITFSAAGLTGVPNPVIMILFNMFSSLAAIMINIIFVSALAASKVQIVIPVIKTFVDNHTSVQDKPLQILGVFAVLVFTPVYWGLYALNRLRG